MTRSGICTGLLFLVACTAQAGQDSGKAAQQWLEKMASAVRTLSYEGTFVRLHGNQIEGMRVIHRVDGRREQERLVSLNGAAREVIRDNESVTCILPDEKTILVHQRRPDRGIASRFPANPEQYAASYRFKVIGDARMTGRAAKVLAIVPKDRFRFGYRVYLDAETGLPLKFDVMGQGVRPVEQIMFTSLEVNDSIDPSRLEPVSEGTTYTLVKKSRPKSPGNGDAASEWQFGNLPAGFTLAGYDQRPTADGKGRVDHFVFSDGIASLSVYVEKEDVEAGFRGAYRLGALHAFAKATDGHQVTAVGEVPAVTVRQVVESATRVIQAVP